MKRGAYGIIDFYSLSHWQVGGLLRANFHAEYAPLPRIIYFVGKWAISGHPWATIFMVNEKAVQVNTGKEKASEDFSGAEGA